MKLIETYFDQFLEKFKPQDFYEISIIIISLDQ